MQTTKGDEFRNFVWAQDQLQSCIKSRILDVLDTIDSMIDAIGNGISITKYNMPDEHDYLDAPENIYLYIHFSNGKVLKFNYIDFTIEIIADK